MLQSVGKVSRRDTLRALGLGAVAAPFVWTKAAAAGQVIIRSPGGTPEENSRKFVWTPFEQETGIKVVPVAATAAKLFAMFKAGNVELDIIDIGAGPLITLSRMGALAPIDYASWKRTDPNDIPAAHRQKYYLGYTMFGTVLGFNKAALGSKTPKNWAEFWDVKAFPGPRSLADLATGNPNLEAALLADGVPRDKIYPMDLDRAFASLSRIRKDIVKFWDTGALSIQMLVDKEVHMTSIWTSRINPAILAGQPVGFPWEDHMAIAQAYGIFKDSKNVENAQKYLEFALRPEIQAASMPASLSGPVNDKAFKLLPPDYGAKVPGSPQTRDRGFFINDEWWEDNREAVNRRWAQWIQS